MQISEPGWIVIDPDENPVSVWFDEELADAEAGDLNSFENGYRILNCMVSWTDRE